MPLHFTPGHPAIKLKGMEYCDLTDKELKMPITKGKKINKLQENSERQFNEFRNKISE